MNDSEKENGKYKHDKHIKEKELSRDSKENDKIIASSSDGKIMTVCFDLQAVLQIPCGDVATLYYKRKLSCFNFTFFDLASKNGTCFFWNEAIAERGSNEIGTCILEYLRDKNVENVIFYSDNCSGQNKNKYILSLYMYIVQNMNIHSITHKFLIVGHTQNEGDNMHSLIEKNKKQCLKSGPIYVPDQLLPIIQLAKKNGSPYVVNHLQTEQVVDLKDLCPKIGNNFTKNTTGEPVVWNEIKMFSVFKNEPNLVRYRTSYEEPNDVSLMFQMVKRR